MLFVVVMAQHFISQNFKELMEKDKVIYNYGTMEGYEQGYIFNVLPEGHVTCACMLSQRKCYFLKHHPSTGAWPVHYLVSKQVYAPLLTREKNVHVLSVSYGLVQFADA